MLSTSSISRNAMMTPDVLSSPAVGLDLGKRVGRVESLIAELYRSVSVSNETQQASVSSALTLLEARQEELSARLVVASVTNGDHRSSLPPAVSAALSQVAAALEKNTR